MWTILDSIAPRSVWRPTLAPSTRECKSDREWSHHTTTRIAFFNPVGTERHGILIENKRTYRNTGLRPNLTLTSTTSQLPTEVMDNKNEITYIEEQSSQTADTANVDLLSTDGTVLIPQPTADLNGESHFAGQRACIMADLSS